ncbi:MAG: hypothetical protein ACYTG0_08570 [Planctomycetota bacterium]
MTDAELGKIDADLRSRDWRERRRALWRMAHAGCSADLVIDKYVASNDFVFQNFRDYLGTPIRQVLQVLGKPALPRLYHHLRRTEKGYERFKVFEAIVLLGEPDEAGRRALGKLAKDWGDDADLRYMLLILRAGASAPNEAKTLMVKVLQEPVCPSLSAHGGGALWPFVVYDSTRARALEEARNRLKGGLAALKEEANRDVDYRTDCLHSLCALFVATRLGVLTSADTSLLDDPRIESSRLRWREWPVPPLLMARWRAGGRADQRRLDELLKVAGASRSRMLDGMMMYLMYMADHMLSAGDVPALVARATDETAEEEIRVGAIFLLGLRGTLPKDATKALLRLTTSESARVSFMKAWAIDAILENPTAVPDITPAAPSTISMEPERGTSRPSIRTSPKWITPMTPSPWQSTAAWPQSSPGKRAYAKAV